MDGRWKKLALGGALALTVGCHRNVVQNPTLPPAQGKQSLLSRAFGDKPQFQPQAPAAEPVVVKEKRKPGQGMKPETEVELANTEFEAAFMEGRSPVERDQLLDTARQRYQRAIAADPKNKSAYIGLARLYVKAGDKERAVAAYKAVLNLNPKDHELAHKMATVQIKFADWAGAVESTRFALSLDPENRTYLKTLGYCQAQMGQWEEAFTSLMKVMPEAQARYFLGRVLIDQNQLDGARQQMQSAVNLDPEYAAAKQVLSDLASGRVLNPDVVNVGHEEPGK